MGHPAFRRQPALLAGCHTHTLAETWRVYKTLCRACWDSSQLLVLGGKRQRETRRGSPASCLLLSPAAPVGNRPCTGLWSAHAFSGPCVRILIPPFFRIPSPRQAASALATTASSYCHLQTSRPLAASLAGCGGAIRLEGP